MLGGLRVPDAALDKLAALVRASGGDMLADRVERAVADHVRLLGLTLDERAIRSAPSTTRPTRSSSSGQRWCGSSSNESAKA